MSQSTKQRGRRKDPALIERRRREILQTAAAFFAREGYPDTDIQHIADRLGVAKGTIYRYFPSKEKLFLAATDAGMRDLHAFVLAGYADLSDPLDRLRAAIRAYLEFFKLHPELTELLIIERAEFRDRKKHTYFEHQQNNACEWHEVFSELVRKGRVRDIPVSRIMDVISDLVYGTMFTNHFSGRHKPLDAQAQDIVDVFFNGILTPAERRRRES
jgi:AcrR family transcriptional regulator